ncbi:hypothetical protein HMPREF3192_00001, partial [Atopobium deltae]
MGQESGQELLAYFRFAALEEYCFLLCSTDTFLPQILIFIFAVN